MPNEPSQSAPTEIRAIGLWKSFGEHVVIRDVSLEVRRGEIVAIVGASGSGKSVLLNMLSWLLRPDAGRVLIADHSRPGAPLADLAGLSEEELDALRLHWSLVFQRNALFSGTVHDNIALWMREHTQMAEAEIDARVRESLEAVALEPETAKKDREQLSGGMAKRAAIARAIAIDPAIVFYDEPTTGLDPVVSGHIHELIFNLHHRERAGEARTTVFVTHDKELLRRVAPRVVMLHEAAVCFDGSYEEFQRTDIEPARQYLQAMPVLHARFE